MYGQPLTHCNGYNNNMACNTGEPRYLRVLGARKGLCYVAPLQANNFIPW